MKKYVLGAFIGFLLLMSGCRDQQDGVHTDDTDLQKEKLTIMHVDAESPGFRKFIENAEKELNLEIETIACPADADVRQAKISTILEAGDSSIDIFSVNDEMISEFKYKDYLKPLNDTVMTKELLSSYPESYMQNVPMKDGKVYSVPLPYGYYGILGKPGSHRRPGDPDAGRFCCLFERKPGQRCLRIWRSMGSVLCVQ